MDTTTINTTTMSDSDSIFNSPTIMNLPSTQFIGGAATATDKTLSTVVGNLTLKGNPTPPEGWNITPAPVPIEPIGMPVYLSGIIQLLTGIILLSKQKTRPAMLVFCTIGLYMLIVHCAYAGKSNMIKKSQLNSICRNLSYLMVLFPLIGVLFILIEDFENAFNNINYNPGKIKLQLPSFAIKKDEYEDDEED